MKLDIATLTPRQYEQVQVCLPARVASEDRFSPGDVLIGGPWNIQFIVDAVPADGDRPKANITNQGNALELTWLERPLAHGENTVVRLPQLLQLGGVLISVRLSTLPEFECKTISRPRVTGSDCLVPPELLGQAPSSQTIAQWFEALGGLQRAAADTPDFYHIAARAVVSPGGFDAGIILLLRNRQWKIAAHHTEDPELGIGFCRELVQRVCDDGRTYYHEANPERQIADESIVASPIFDSSNSVVGAVYALRSLRGKNNRSGNRPLEARWVQVVAEGIGTGLSRMRAQAEATRTRVLFEQSFSPAVVRELIDNPDVLEGQDRVITVLFNDVRNFTAITDKLGAKRTYQLLSELMDRLTNEIMKRDGVIIDYYGDGLAAMWNAPTDQPTHALLACQAGFAMQQSLAELNKTWMHLLTEPLQMGTGIHTGHAMVGNAGSHRRLKYGPRGQSVNLASRVEGATKHLEVSVVITEETRMAVGSAAVTRRLCRCQLAGIREAVNIYELVSLDPATIGAGIQNRLRRYEDALALFEQGELEAAERTLEALPHDSSEQFISTGFLQKALSSFAATDADIVAAAGTFCFTK